MVIVMVMGFLVCYLPYAFFALWVVNNRGQPFDLRLATIPSCVTKASTVYNPVIYILLNKQVRSFYSDRPVDRGRQCPLLVVFHTKTNEKTHLPMIQER